MAGLTIKKRVKNCIIYEEGAIKIENVRFSFPHLDKPYKGKDSENDPNKVAKYGITGMLSKKTHVEAKDALMTFINELIAAKQKVKNKIPPKDRFFRNGDDEKQAEYEDHWIISASEIKRPAVRNRKGELIQEPEKIADLIEGGYWGHILIKPWFQDNKHGQKVNAGLVGVQHVKDDETFGTGRIDDTDAWGDESDGADEEGGAIENDDDM